MSKVIKNKKVSTYLNGELEEETVGVPVEMPAQFIINDRELLKIMVTPVHLREFAIGFLAGHGLIEKLEDIKTELVGEKKAILYFELKKEVFASSLTLISNLNPGCSGDVSFKALKLPKIKTAYKFKIEDLIDLMKKVVQFAQMNKSSGSLYFSGLSVADKLMFKFEDIGLNNAVDKAIGAGFIKGIDFSGSTLFSIGKATFETVAKASRLNIPVLVSCTSPTNLAVSLAEKQGLTLISCEKCGKVRVYSGFERLKEK